MYSYNYNSFKLSFTYTLKKYLNVLVFNILIMDSENFIVKFKRKSTKKGKYYYFNIPIQLIRSEIVNPNEKYEIKIYKI